MTRFPDSGAAPGGYLGFLRSNAPSAKYLVAAWVGVTLFALQQSGLLVRIGAPYDLTVVGLAAGLLSGYAYFGLVAFLVFSFCKGRQTLALEKLAVAHAPVALLGLYPLDFEILSLHLPKLNRCLSYIILFAALIAVLYLAFSKERFGYVKRVLKYLFVAWMLLLIVQSLGFELLQSRLLEKLPLDYSAYCATALGLLVLFLHRKEIQQEEEETAARFKAPDPEGARIWRRPRRLQSILLCLLLLGAAFVVSYHLNGHEFGNDEFQTMGAAKGFLETGKFFNWEWHESAEENARLASQEKHPYTRAWPHTILISLSFLLFGESEVTARLPSVFCALVFYLLVYIFSNYLWRDRWRSLFIALVCVFFPDLLTTFRTVRMYALLVPLTLLVFYFLLRWLKEPNRIDYRIGWLNAFSRRCFDFDLRLLLAALALLALAVVVHINVLILLPFLLMFALWMVLVERDPRYALLAALGVLFCFLVYYLATHTGLSIFGVIAAKLSLFTQTNYGYQTFFLSFPVGCFFAFTLFVMGAGLAFFDPRPDRRRQSAAFLLVNMVTIAFFALVAARYMAGKYVIHIVPLAVIFNLGTLLSLLRIYPRAVRTTVAGALLCSVGVNFQRSTEAIYGSPYVYEPHGAAYAVIRRNLDPETQAVFYQYLRSFYLRGFPKNTQYISMRSNKQYKLPEFLADMVRFKSGWVTWAKYKSSHLDSKVYDFITHHLRNRTLVSNDIHVYFYETEKLKGLLAEDRVSKLLSLSLLRPGKIDQVFVRGFETWRKLDLAKPLSIGFWLRSFEGTPGSPLELGSHDAGGVTVESSDRFCLGGLRFIYAKDGADKAACTGPINDDTWHHLVWYQAGGETGAEWGLFVDGQKLEPRQVPTPRDAVIDFKTLTFKGAIEDLRVYDFALSQDQVSALFNNGQGTLATTLGPDGAKFTPSEHWLAFEEKNGTENDGGVTPP